MVFCSSWKIVNSEGGLIEHIKTHKCYASLEETERLEFTMLLSILWISFWPQKCGYGYICRVWHGGCCCFRERRLCRRTVQCSKGGKQRPSVKRCSLDTVISSYWIHFVTTWEITKIIICENCKLENKANLYMDWVWCDDQLYHRSADDCFSSFNNLLRIVIYQFLSIAICFYYFEVHDSRLIDVVVIVDF